MKKIFVAACCVLGALTLAVVLSLGAGPVSAAPGVEKEPCKPRVPADQLAAMKKLKNPFPATPENIAQGKAIFEGKGTCFTCHNLGGKGDADAGKVLDPGPRNFTNPTFHSCKTDGEMFWLIKNGSPPGSTVMGGMIPAVVTGIITEQEAWKAILYERTFKGKK